MNTSFSSSPAYIALGSNLGNSRNILRQAFHRLAALSLRPALASSLWETTPVDCPPGSPMFLNAVVQIQPASTPEGLLEELQSIEKQMGRQPKVILNEPRPLDLDIITFGEEQLISERLTLPHPRAKCRRFVLEPLCELAPALVLPGQLKTVRQLLECLQTQEVLRCLGADWTD